MAPQGLHFTSLFPSFIQSVTNPHEPTALFEGVCPVTGQTLTLPRTRLAERVAEELMSSLPDARENKMYGVLLVCNSAGELGYLKAFSGKLDGTFHHAGWAPPMLELEPSPLENLTKTTLAEMKIELQRLAAIPLYQEREHIHREWGKRHETLQTELRERKKQRAKRRVAGESEEILAAQSREDSRRRREFKQEHETAMKPLREVEDRIALLKSRRRELSRALQAELHDRFQSAAWAGECWSLTSLFPSGPPTGIGECCAPKLLSLARRSRLEPLALAEFWWGESSTDRRRGAFYPPCLERCMPLLGPLLSQAPLQIETIFEDEHIRAVVKPSGLLTVPGRQSWNQDCLLSRLGPERLLPVHRLNLETSGLVLFARTLEARKHLQRAFADRRIEKVYQALLVGCPSRKAGRLSGCVKAAGKGRYQLHRDGRASVTEYRVIDKKQARLELKPLSGRSHQLRVHCAYELGLPILGDPIYGEKVERARLMLHAHRLNFDHPVTGQKMVLTSAVPF